MGRRVARARRRFRHRAGQCRRPRDPRRRAREPRFIERATSDFEDYRGVRSKSYTLEYAREDDRRPGRASSASSRTRMRARRRAQLCWTLGITEHHNAVDNVRALINLALLTGHVGRYGRASVRCAGRTTCRAAATWALSRTSIPAAKTSRMRRCVAKFERAWGARLPPHARHGISPRCSTRSSAGSSTRSTSSARIRRNPKPTRHTREPAAQPRAPHRAGHLPDEDRRDGRRRVAGGGELVRIAKAP